MILPTESDEVAHRIPWFRIVKLPSRGDMVDMKPLAVLGQMVGFGHPAHLTLASVTFPDCLLLPLIPSVPIPVKTALVGGVIFTGSPFNFALRGAKTSFAIVN
jgi:hypothetical protein